MSTTNLTNTFIPDRKVAERYSVSRTTIWRWVRSNDFPHPVKIAGTTRWRLADLEAWEDDKIEEVA